MTADMSTEVNILHAQPYDVKVIAFTRWRDCVAVPGRGSAAADSQSVIKQSIILEFRISY